METLLYLIFSLSDLKVPSDLPPFNFLKAAWCLVVRL